MSNDVFWSHQAKKNMAEALLLLKEGKLAAYWYDDGDIRYFVQFKESDITKHDETYIYTRYGYRFHQKWFWHVNEIHPKRGGTGFRVVQYQGQRIGKK